jgi:FMN phosphatase YigB (HAD superfamily)
VAFVAKNNMTKLQKIDTLLLDLDGTLLHFNLDDFIVGYMNMIREHFSKFSWADQIENWILTGTGLMLNNKSSKTNKQVFIQYFSSMSGLKEEDIWLNFMDFYQNKFDRLQEISDRDHNAIRFIEKAVSYGYQLVLATQPIFPEIAIRKRLRWAGLDKIPFRLITDIEKMNASKPSLEYFLQLLDLIRADSGKCVMVGNDPVADMGAEKAGIATFFLITEENQVIPPQAKFAGQFSDLEKLLGWD